MSYETFISKFKVQILSPQNNNSFYFFKSYVKERQQIGYESVWIQLIFVETENIIVK